MIPCWANNRNNPQEDQIFTIKTIILIKGVQQYLNWLLHQLISFYRIKRCTQYNNMW